LYSGREARKVAKLSRCTQIKMAFRTEIAIQNILEPHSQQTSNTETASAKRNILLLSKIIVVAGRTFRT
jgi:hypothetical protein